MAISLSFQPASLGSLSAIAPFAAPPLTATRSTVVAETPSTIVSLSALGRLLAATATTGGSPQSTAGLNTPVVSATRQAGALAADIFAARQETLAARISLQSLIDDPALRAIANSRFNPVYSALVAASHQADFTTPQPLTRANAIPVDIPAPVLAAEPVDSIRNDNEAAREFAYEPSLTSH